MSKPGQMAGSSFRTRTPHPRLFKPVAVKLAVKIDRGREARAQALAYALCEQPILLNG